MRRLRATGGTDVGRVRTGNEDSYLIAESVFAVADGMGGHLAGEIASAKALEPVEALDGRVFGDPQDADEALRAAVIEANDVVSQMADDEPAYRGMGTTLTAAMLEGPRLHLAHVGDSRAYLLRNGRFEQLTDDHTLVQHLIDEGQITREEAATHPQRSIITRAIGVSHDVEVDSMTIEIEPDDQVLLCSDGLTGVLDDDHIAQELASGDDTQQVITRLIEAANQRGGPDNITLVILRCEPEPDDPLPAATRGGAAAAEAGHDADSGTGSGERRHGGAPVTIRTREDSVSRDWAGGLGNYGALGRGGPPPKDDADGRSRRWIGRLSATLLALVVLGGLVFVGGRFLLSQQYFVGVDDRQVVIYQGVDVSIGPWDLARLVERTDLTLDDVPAWYQPALEDGIHATDRAMARRIVAGAPRREATDASADDDPAEAEPTDDDPTEQP
ncbi:MAG: Stp1/IreP family PP2C-type Ser/Thr phosphatase [Actinobacteria bacterium]|jgi:protein phosphatase|nr:Stp1/IreP family PP2C-type Ser/Thr phosphatase [Actinomycetota bacterium]